MSEVAVVIPIIKPNRTPDEHIAWQHLTQYLGSYDRVLVTPDNLQLEQNTLPIRRFASRYFKNITTYSKLLLSADFYRIFEAYQFILIYQLDCLALGDTLCKWITKGYDYIGAPLFNCKVDPTAGFSRVGNGGFCLRRVDACLQVLSSHIRPSLTALWSDLMPDLARTRPVKRLKVLHTARRGVQWYASHYTLNEDLFWSDRARLFDPSFRIAPINLGLQFAFERFPRYCLKQNNYCLPFGAHAWPKWDRAFWEPYLLE